MFAATHSKLRKAADGTSTPVATYMIKKWTAKINKKEIYNGKCPPRARQEKKARERRRKTIAVPTTPESFRR